MSELTNKTLLNEVIKDNLSLELSLYLTLLSLNNNHYNKKHEEEKLNIVEDFLRKVNNLKVKIQLKRKQSEIDKLIKDIINIYNNNNSLIIKYIPNTINIEETLNSMDPKSLTNIIDIGTKEKLTRTRNQDEYNNIRTKLINNNYTYTCNDLNITFINNNDTFNITWNEFYKVFEYLLDIDNYPQPFLTPKANRLHTIHIADIIKIIQDKDYNSIPDNIVISLILNNKLNIGDNIENIDTSSFKIENIKITDLYKEANNNTTIPHARWQKISITNTYLYQKLNTIISNGMYYYNEDRLILENIISNTSDFKVSININDMLIFLETNLKTNK